MARKQVAPAGQQDFLGNSAGDAPPQPPENPGTQDPQKRATHKEKPIKSKPKNPDPKPPKAVKSRGPTIANPGDDGPYSLLRGELQIGDLGLECHVLSNGRRVLTQREVVRVLTAGRVASDLQRYLARNPYLGELEIGEPIQFRVPGVPQLANGYDATVLIEICSSYLKARKNGLLKPSQFHLAVQAEIVITACAKVGIIALIDEATGYQKIRAKNALQLKLQAFIADELQEWAIMFPSEFWLELARLEGLKYDPQHRPIRWGKYIMMFVYDAIDEDVGNELRKKNPNPHFLQNHHQWLKDFGRQKVNNQIQQVIAIMKLCRDIADFKEKFAYVFKKSDLQMTFDDIGWDASRK